jgi:hypothetical protein
LLIYSRIEFHATFVPSGLFCLLSLLGTRALADDAFEGGYKTWDELLNKPKLEPGIDEIHLPLKSGIKKRAIPLGQEQMGRIFKRVVQVSGIRKPIKPYSMRVGAAGRINGIYIDISLPY